MIGVGIKSPAANRRDGEVLRNLPLRSARFPFRAQTFASGTMNRSFLSTSRIRARSARWVSPPRSM